jgi:hypothetical protein
MLDKELQKTVRGAKQGRRYLDKLVKVWLKVVGSLSGAVRGGDRHTCSGGRIFAVAPFAKSA